MTQINGTMQTRPGIPDDPFRSYLWQSFELRRMPYRDPLSSTMIPENAEKSSLKPVGNPPKHPKRALRHDRKARFARCFYAFFPAPEKTKYPAARPKRRKIRCHQAKPEESTCTSRNTAEPAVKPDTAQ